MKNNKLVFVLAFMLFLIVFLLFKIQNNNVAVEKSETVYSEVTKSGKIRVGYISYPPSFIKDPNTGEFSGIFNDVLEEVAKKLSLELDYVEELGWGTMIESINSGRIDLIATGIWPTTERGKHVDFVNPLYFSAVKAYVRIDDNRFDGDLSKINDSNIKISLIDGEMTSVIANMDYPKANQLSLTQMNDLSQVLLNVATKKADVTFAEPAVALEYMSKNPNSIKEVENVLPVRIFPNAMIVGKGEVEFLSTLNISINELINNGFVDKIIEKYEKYPDSFQRLSLPFSIN